MLEEEKLHKTDVEKEVDLLISISNLIKAEEHCHNSYQKTKDELYLSLSETIRNIRGELMNLFLKNVELNGDDWCIIKHLLSAFYGLRESSQKFISSDAETAKKLMEYSSKILEIFAGLISLKKK